MSKKLLEESTIRSFMKLANLQPLSEKFISEKYMSEEEHEEEHEEEDEEDDKKVHEELDEEVVEEEGQALEEEVVEEGDVTEEGKESEGRPSTPRPKVKGVAKPGKMHAAKNAPGDAKLKAMKQTHVHSDKPDTIEHNKKSNAPKKNNTQFDIVSESLEEEMDEEAEAPEAPEAPEMAAGDDMGSAGETGDHKEKMKGLIRDMLGKLSEMGAEYGLNMEVSDEGGGEGGEEAPPEGEAPPTGGEEEMQQKLDEMVEKLTKRVAARLVKESKKKR